MVHHGFLVVNAGILLLLATCAGGQDSYNITSVDGVNVVRIRNRYGEPILIDECLMKRLNEEDSTWHWTPWLRTRTQVTNGVVMQDDCTKDAAIDNFPDGLFTDEQLRQGGFLLYLLLGIYCFTLLSEICSDYFLPCVELICDDLKIPPNIAAATFMAVATSCPEFFVNVISTFITGSSMGIGTIIGSALFNLLGVGAIGGLAARMPIKIDLRPLTRDAIVYMINVAALFIIVWDGQIDWQESVVLAVMYILYFVFMFNSLRVFKLIDKIIARFKNDADKQEEPNPNVEAGVENLGFRESLSHISFPHDGTKPSDEELEAAIETPRQVLFRYPKDDSRVYRCWWVFSWPIKFILFVTVPSPISMRRWYPLTFIMCIVWIGINSYLVSWSMTVLGHTFFIPESVMGMTFLAFGGCMPEAFSIFIMSRKGLGGIGVSNALGANSLAILFALGLPWLIKCLTLVAQGAEDTAVLLDSSGIDFIVGSLLVAVTLLWLTLFIGKFELKKSVGVCLLSLYVFFITFAILLELGIIFNDAVMRCFSN